MPRVGVVGNGLIGHGVAQIFASAGFDVTMVGRSEESLRRALEKIERSLEQFRDHGLAPAADALERVTTTTSLDDLTGAELVERGEQTMSEHDVEKLAARRTEELFARLRQDRER